MSTFEHIHHGEADGPKETLGQKRVRLAKEKVERSERALAEHLEASGKRLTGEQEDVFTNNQQVQQEVQDATDQFRANLGPLNQKLEGLKEPRRKARHQADRAEALVPAVLVRPVSTIIKDKGLPGAELDIKAVHRLKPLLMLVSLVLSGFSIGVVTTILTPRHIFDRPVGLVLSVIFGAALSLGLRIFASAGWALYGRRVAHGRTAGPTLQALSVMTLMLVTIFAVIDSEGIYQLNASLAQMNPQLQMGRLTALLIGSAISGIYVGAISVTGYVDGYNVAVAALIEGERESDLQRAENDPDFVAFQRQARDLRAQSNAIEKDIKEVESERSELVTEFHDKVDGLNARLKTPPVSAEDAVAKQMIADIAAHREELYKAILLEGGTLL